ncbi:MAG TPA: glycosyltransferase family 4 protein, partial [Allosphingosinicella sp.]|nr:glycosyltransferase family 4 protein [Allosphingosinicella sp.]
MKPSLRILITTDSTGDLWQYGLDLARGLSRLGHETVLALTGQAATSEQIGAAAAIPGLRLADAGLANEGVAETEASMARAARAIAALADETECDIVQLNSPALAALADFGRPVVAVLHGCIASRWEAVEGTKLPARFEWRTELVARGLRSAGALVAPTAAFGASVARHYCLESAPSTVHYGRSPVAVPNGVPHDFVFTSGRLWDEDKNFGMLDAAAGRIGVPVRAAGPL